MEADSDSKCQVSKGYHQDDPSRQAGYISSVVIEMAEKVGGPPRFRHRPLRSSVDVQGNRHTRIFQ